MSERRTAAAVLRGVAHAGTVRLARPEPVSAPEQASDVSVTAYQEGLRLGRAEAQADLARAHLAARREQQLQAERDSRQLQASLQRLGDLVQALQAAGQQRLAALSQDAIALAFVAVTRIVSERAHDRATLEHLIEEGFGQLQGGLVTSIRLCAADLHAIESDDPTFLTRWPSVQWLADSALRSGGCLLDTPAGTLDLRIETQLAQLRMLWSASAEVAVPPSGVRVTAPPATQSPVALSVAQNVPAPAAGQGTEQHR